MLKNRKRSGKHNMVPTTITEIQLSMLQNCHHFIFPLNDRKSLTFNAQLTDVSSLGEDAEPWFKVSGLTRNINIV